MTRLDHMRVRMVNGHVEAQRLQEDVFVEHQVLCLLDVRVLGGLLARQTHVGDPDHMLQFPRLLFDLEGGTVCFDICFPSLRLLLNNSPWPPGTGWPPLFHSDGSA